MIKMSVIDRLTKRQAVTIAHMQLDVSPAREIVGVLSHLDEILTDYEVHDWCDHPDYKRYSRVFRQNVKSLMVLSRCLAFIFDK
jgi:hypothetical protein